MIGPPCGGKSTLVARHFGDYVRISQTELQTKEKCMKACKDALQAGGKSVVVDNQNRDRDTRNGYIGIAAAFGVPVRAIHLDMPKGFCFHLNSYRTLQGHESIPDI